MLGWDGSYEEWVQELNYEHELSYWQDHNAWQEDGAAKSTRNCPLWFAGQCQDVLQP